MDREFALQAVRDRFEAPLWALIGQLEATLADLAHVKHIDLTDPRAVGSVLNSALPDSAISAGFPDLGIETTYVSDGRSNKITATLHDQSVSFELHLCGPRGGTSKSSHQFAGFDIEREPALPGFVIEAPSGMLLFIGLYLSSTFTIVERAFIKFADGVDQRMIQIHRSDPIAMTASTEDAPADVPVGTKLTIRKPKGEQKENGSTTNQRGDAAPSSK